MTDSLKAWSLLKEYVGKYRGRGVNHEGQDFVGDLSLAFDFDDKVLLLVSSATGSNNEVFHKERSWIGFDISGQLLMYVCSNNHPGITPHHFNRIEESSDGTKKLVFRFGNLEDKNSFREEVNINVTPNQIEHFYSWGLPGSEFEPRSGSKMQKVTL